MASREKDQADFDLERFIDMFDQAMTSQDPRVIDALRSLMMMVILTKPEGRSSPAIDRQQGPLRRMYDDLNNIGRRLNRIEDDLRSIKNEPTREHEELVRWYKATSQAGYSVPKNTLNP